MAVFGSHIGCAGCDRGVGMRKDLPLPVACLKEAKGGS